MIYRVPDWMETTDLPLTADSIETLAVDDEYEVVGCSCRSRFCPDCMVARGYALRRRIMYHSEIAKFQKPQMWTLTIDPVLFDNAETAYNYCREKRVISQLVRKLRRRGVLLSRHYFVAVEWQKNGMVHYHLLVDAKYIPFDMVCEIWNSNRPESAGPVVGNRPGFGSIRFSVPKFADAVHAVNYATKYVVKPPSDGFPAWVLESQKNIPRYHASRGCFTDTGSDCGKEVVEAEAFGFAPTEVGEHDVEYDPNDHSISDLAVPSDDEEEEETQERKSIAERVADCRSKGVILRRREVTLKGGEVITFRSYVGECLEDFKTLCLAEGFDDGLLPFRFAVSADRVSELLGEVGNGIPESGSATCRRVGLVSETDRERGPRQRRGSGDRWWSGTSVPDDRGGQGGGD